MQHKVLSIAGVDPSGGAGVLADVKSFSALGCYGMAVITAITAQNTKGVSAVFDIGVDAVRQQLESVLADITPDAIKLGMLFHEDIILAVADILKKNILPKKIPIVLDPVMMAKSGDALLQPAGMVALKEKLIPLADIITPNLREAESLGGYSRLSEDMMPECGVSLLSLGCGAVLLKGGHLEDKHANDYYIGQDAPEGVWLEAEKINTKNTHGTGCTLSSAIASYLAKGLSMVEACRFGKDYLLGSIKAVEKKSLGGGAGPVHHFYKIW
ncbi:MAG: bifunctional hydroxymethylpyrimidine kinase/phosphomethylpyrimidine kinase [Alphaproteobacteria bacterium]